LAILSVLSVWGLLSRSSLPKHAGKDVYYWMLQNRSSDLQANPGLNAMGTNAVPFLADALCIRKTVFDRFEWLHSPSVRKALADAAPGFTWTHSAREVQRAAASSLLTFGFQAQPALPALLRTVIDPSIEDNTRQTVIFVLGELGPPIESIRYLSAAWPLTTNESSIARHDLLSILWPIATNSPELTLPIFLSELNSSDEDIRKVAIWGLGALGPIAHSGVPAATAMLQGQNGYSQFAVAVALGRITNRISALLPRLRELARGTNAQPAVGAALTLYRWGDPVENSVTILTQFLGNQQVKGIAAQFLGKIGSGAQAAVPALIAASQKDIGGPVDRYDRARCALAVMQISGRNDIAIQELKSALTFKGNRWVRYAVARDLGNAGQIGQWLADALEQNLTDPYPDARHAASVALGKMGANSDK
jgi:HEAT repeat protein